MSWLGAKNSASERVTPARLPRAFRSLLVTALAVVASATVRGAPATNPSDNESPKSTEKHATAPSQAAKSAWQTTVSAFANALVDDRDVATLHELTSDDVTVRPFDSTGREDIVRLRARVSGMSLLATRAYLDTPQSLATDLAAVVREKADVPDDLKRRLMPSDGEPTRRANATAVKWIASSLLTSGADPIGVIVFWENTGSAADFGSPTSTTGGTNHVLMFILLRGEASSGKFQISQIRYGDPLHGDAADSNLADTDAQDPAGK